MDYNLELVKRYGRVLMGGVTPPVILNILITSVCDMRCVHCFFTEELDDKPRKKLQMTTGQLARVSETLGGKLPILIIAGGEPFTRKDLPEVVRAFYENNELESVYLMSNGGIQQRIMPDVSRPRRMPQSQRHRRARSRRPERTAREDSRQDRELGQGH
jgi:MoaA/NifB/PqqE/SkfB family radical SAM enzyme